MNRHSATASSSSGSSASGDNSKNDGDEKDRDDQMFECNICLDTAKDAVISMCGHLFCWPCLHQWLETRPNKKLCPVCKSGISKEKVIPLYGRGSTNQEDPRNKVPPRPPGQRAEAETGSSFGGFGFGDGFQVSIGIGAFPFNLFVSAFNFTTSQHAPGFHYPRHLMKGHGQIAATELVNNEDDVFLTRMLLFVTTFIFAWLLYA